MDTHPQLRLHRCASPATAAWIGISSYGCMDMRPPATATTTSPELRVQKQSFSDAKGAEGGDTRLPPRATHPTRTEVEISPRCGQRQFGRVPLRAGIPNVDVHGRFNHVHGREKTGRRFSFSCACHAVHTCILVQIYTKSGRKGRQCVLRAI